MSSTVTAAAIYLRISSDPDGQRAGVERQRTECEALAARLGLDVIETYEDNDVSAFSSKARPRFEDMMSDAAAGRFGTVIVWATDRLYRRMSDLVRITSELATRVNIRTVSDGDVDLTTAAGIMHAQMLGAVAEFESRHKGERVSARAEQRARTEGRQTASIRPFGWQWADPCPGGRECAHTSRCDVGQDRRPRLATRRGLIPHPVEGPLMAECIRRVANGASLRSAALWLADQDVHPTLGTRSGQGSSLGQAIRNPRHAGLVSLRGQVVSDAADGLRIIDRETWERANAILSDTSRRTSPGRPVSTPLGGGLLRCGKCGGPMAASKHHDRDGKAPVYICSRELHLTRRRSLLDGPVLGLVGAWLVEHGPAVLRAAHPDSDIAGDSARAELMALETRLTSLSELVADGALSPADYAAASHAIRQRIDAATRRLAGANRRTPLADVLADPAGPAVAYARLRDQADVEPLRRLIACVVDSVTVLPQSRPGRPSLSDLTIRWADGTEFRQEHPQVAPFTSITERRAMLVERLAAGANVSELARQWGVNRHTLQKDLRAIRAEGAR